MAIPGLLNKKQTAYALGVSVPTVRRMIAEGQLSTVRVGALDYVRQIDVEQQQARIALVTAVTSEVLGGLASAGAMSPKQYRRAKRELRR